MPPEWRELFESGDSDLVASHPGLLRLLEKLERDNGANGQPQIAAPAAPASRPSQPGLRRPGSTRRCSAPSPPRWLSSRRIGCTATWPPGSIRSARSRSATCARRDAADRADARAAGAHSRDPAPRPCPGRDAEGGAAESPRGLQRHDGVRDRASLRPRGARVAAAKRSSRAATANRSPARSGSTCSSRSHGQRFEQYLRRVPRPEAVLARRARRDDADARRVDRGSPPMQARTRS